jgi:hypothetical protein
MLTTNSTVPTTINLNPSELVIIFILSGGGISISALIGIGIGEAIGEAIATGVAIAIGVAIATGVAIAIAEGVEDGFGGSE